MHVHCTVLQGQPKLKMVEGGGGPNAGDVAQKLLTAVESVMGLIPAIL